MSSEKKHLKIIKNFCSYLKQFTLKPRMQRCCTQL